jgi:hypothetical protein
LTRKEETITICGAGRSTLRLATLTKTDKNISPLLYKKEGKQGLVHKNKDHPFFSGFLEKLLSCVDKR